MKKTILFSFLLLISLCANSQTVPITVNCTSAGTFQTTLNGLLNTEQQAAVTDLTVTGSINIFDFVQIKNMINNHLVNIDLTGANIVQSNSGSTIFPANQLSENLFYGYGLKSIKLPTTLTAIGKGAFQSCNLLTDVTIPNSVTTIMDNAFQSCYALDTIVIPNSVNSIGSGAFSNCPKLVSVTLSSNLSVLKNGTFGGCVLLETINIPAATYIAQPLAFETCSKLTSITVTAGNPNYTSIDGVLFRGGETTLVIYPNGKSGSYTIPSSVTHIGDSAFYRCTKLNGITLPANLQAVGKYSFYYCTGLSSTLTLPATLNRIDDYAFAACANISGSLVIPNSVNYLGKGAFSYCNYITGLTLSSALTEIKEYTFYENRRIATITIPEGIKRIGWRAFQYCNYTVTNLVIPNSVDTIQDEAFGYWSKLNSLKLSESLKYIGTYAFASNKIKKLIIPASVEWIRDYAFDNCTLIDTIEVKSPNPFSIGYNTFKDVNKTTCKLLVPSGSSSTYANYGNWRYFTNIREADNGILPFLRSSYPTLNKINASLHRDAILTFNEKIIVSKGLTLTDNATNTVVKTYTAGDILIVNDTTVTFRVDSILEHAKNYTITIPQGFVKDVYNNEWPATSAYEIAFATNAHRSNIYVNFDASYNSMVDREYLGWTTINRRVRYEQNWCSGYFSLKVNGVPMRWYGELFVEGENTVPTPSETDIIGVATTNNPMANSRLVVDLSGFNNTVTDITSKVRDNNCAMTTKVYAGGNIVSNKTTSGKNYQYRREYFENENAVKIDSVVLMSYEGDIASLDIELIDLTAPVVELGNSRTLCQGDSTQLDAGFTPGAVYTWSNNAKTRKIWAKTSDTYSVTVKNTLGTVTDNVQVIVRPGITLTQHPDTLDASVGDTLTLTAGTDPNYTYLWYPGGETTPTIRATKGGKYKVLISNGGCLKLDSIYINMKGAKLRAYFQPGGVAGINDVQGELYKKVQVGMITLFTLYKSKVMPQFVDFDSLPAGDYLFKAHFVSYSFTGTNRYADTYHNGQTTWSAVTPFHLTCNSDTLISFLLANRPNSYTFNGTGTIAGQVVVPAPNQVRAKVQSTVADQFGDILILLYDGNGNIIATTYPDANGNYSFNNLPAGNYSVGVERTGFTVQTLFTTTLPDGGTVSNANFTVNNDTQTIIPALPSGINDLSKNKQLTVFPNPVKTGSVVYLKASFSFKGSVSLEDLSGKTIYTLNMIVTENMNQINLGTNLSSGVYFLKIKTEKETYTQRIIIQ